MEREAKPILLTVTSRVFDRPISIAVKGPFSAGRSFLAEMVISFCSAASCYALTAMWERAQAHSEERLNHRENETRLLSLTLARWPRADSGHSRGAG